jgi:hypothetical protein
VAVDPCRGRLVVDVLSLASSEPRFASAIIIPWDKILIAHLQ